MKTETKATKRLADHSTIAIITARGGSKRIPRKNIKNFCGKPIIEYSIAAALASGIFDEVMVSTEDQEIAQISIKSGAKVPFLRSAATANDYSTTAEVLTEVIQSYLKIGRSFARACCIYPTAPFVTPEKLRAAMALLQEGHTEVVIPVTPFSFSPLRAMIIRQNKLQYCHPEYADSRSQDLEIMYHDCGQFYCFKPDVLLRKKRLLTDSVKALIVPEQEVQDIDTLQDWEIAEIKYQRLVMRMQRENEGNLQYGGVWNNIK